MHLLIKLVDGESLRLDAGFVDRLLTREIVELNMTHFIFPKKNSRAQWESCVEMHVSLAA